MSDIKCRREGLAQLFYNLCYKKALQLNQKWKTIPFCNAFTRFRRYHLAYYFNHLDMNDTYHIIHFTYKLLLDK